MGKIFPREQLIPLINEAKQNSRIVGFANGCFDLIHVGHVRYLTDAREHCDVLVVAMNTDESVRRIKGDGRPLVPLAERMEVMAAFGCVDLVTWFDDPTVVEILKELKPDIQFKGTDYTEDTVPERHVMVELGGRVMIVGDPKDHSTTEMMERLEQEPDR